MSEQEIYLRFIDWMKQSAWGMPETEVMESLVKALYAPEDASLLTGMPFLPKKIAALAELKQMPTEELSVKLDALAKKGLVFRFLKDGTVYYNLLEFIYAQNPSFMNERTDNDIRKLASLVNQNYYSGGWDLSNEIKMKTLRAIPIKATIEDPRQILPYEDVAAIFDSLDYFCLSPCSCKKNEKSRS